MQNNIDDTHNQDHSIEELIPKNDSSPSEDSQNLNFPPTEFTDSITVIESQLQRGNIQEARILYRCMNSDIKQKYADERRLQSVKRYLEFDRSEFWVPFILFIFWFFIAFRSI
jgi:hypothetical protein